MDKIVITKQITHEPKPSEVARMFCSMDDTEMAIFFNTVAWVVDNEWTNPLSFQLASVTGNKSLTEQGRKVMQEIGEYSNPE